ncbi:polysaccharide deacetylase family protein [uncultured Algibacter sp.]|uniref:polysaccharide deacetylase family protein n=1 Tax=uncultured Algibacter sp. TaxID=298659 RepID=UPI002632C095|nr:polysaccharide deacetylase family protein [uncultured Algibacter sp.]
MTLKPIKTPKVAKKMFPNYIWDIPTKEKVIYLTFDDGPTPIITNWTLDILDKYNAKATFFCIGNNIEKHPAIFQNIIEKGHAIGNHTHNHLKGWKTKTKDYLENICDAQTTINSEISNSSIVNQKSLIVNLFRPPYGKIKPKQGRKLIELGYKIVMWDILPFDWDKTVNPETCYNNAITKTNKGSIIVFHDSVKASKNMQFALPRMLEYFSKKGYKFKSVNV